MSRRHAIFYIIIYIYFFYKGFIKKRCDGVTGHLMVNYFEDYGGSYNYF